VGGELCPWEGKFAIESNWPNEDSGWMIDVFNASVPDFDFERFHEWMNRVRFGAEPGLLLQAPLCTAHPDSYPKVKVPCVVGEELMTPVDQPPADAQVPKDKEEADCMKPVDEVEQVAGAVEQEPIPVAAVEQAKLADALIPVVGEGGKRVDKAAPRQVSPRKVVEPKRGVVMGKCSHKPFLKKDGSKADCVCQWTPPKRRGEESQAAYKSRISDWEKVRNAVAKKRGIVLPQ
jgi:hypothetical protein